MAPSPRLFSGPRGAAFKRAGKTADTEGNQFQNGGADAFQNKGIEFMGEVNINNLQEGMKLGADVVNFNGTVLLKAGAVITRRHLDAFQMWGITAADIIGVEDGEMMENVLETVDPRTAARIDTELAARFQKTNPDDPIIAELYRIVKLRRLQGGPDAACGSS